MANTWFRFKQFEIQQDRCAMKVGTDGVILGAWTCVERRNRVLDVGTGTGLLALMLAQRATGASVDALEIDPEAAAQATENVAASPYSDRILVHQGSFQDFLEQPGLPEYDLVVCNPPYFSDSLRPVDDGRTIARHDERLTLHELIHGTSGLLSNEGALSLVLPAEVSERVISLARNTGLHLHRLLHIHPVPGRPAKRVCMELGRKKQFVREESLIIEKGGRRRYSEDYSRLTGPFYL